MQTHIDCRRIAGSVLTGFPSPHRALFHQPPSGSCMVRPTRGPPCCRRGCPTPNADAGQWQFVPEAFRVANGLPEGAKCRRWRGILGEKQAPGRKAARRGDGGEGGCSTDRQVDGLCPAAYRVASIDEIWGARCVQPACLLCPAAQQPLTSSHGCLHSPCLQVRGAQCDGPSRLHAARQCATLAQAQQCARVRDPRQVPPVQL